MSFEDMLSHGRGGREDLVARGTRGGDGNGEFGRDVLRGSEGKGVLETPNVSAPSRGELSCERFPGMGRLMGRGEVGKFRVERALEQGQVGEETRAPGTGVGRKERAKGRRS